MDIDKFLNELKTVSNISFAESCINEISGVSKGKEKLNVPISLDDFKNYLYKRYSIHKSSTKLDEEREMLAQQLKILFEEEKISLDEKGCVYLKPSYFSR